MRPGPTPINQPCSTARLCYLCAACAGPSTTGGKASSGSGSMYSCAHSSTHLLQHPGLAQNASEPHERNAMSQPVSHAMSQPVSGNVGFWMATGTVKRSILGRGSRRRRYQASCSLQNKRVPAITGGAAHLNLVRRVPLLLQVPLLRQLL